MTGTAEHWLLDDIAATAARLSACCYVAILSEDFESKILLGRFAHDEATLLTDACGRLAEIAIDAAAPTNLAAALQGRAIPIPERLDAAFMGQDDWIAHQAALATSPIADEPTHRYRAKRNAVRRRQSAGIRAADLIEPAAAAATPHTLTDIVETMRLVEHPGRPATLRLSDDRVPVGSTGTARMALLQQNLVNLEIPTIELCCSLILEGATLPLDFVADMARQAWDEARHARLFWTRLDELGGTVEAFPASTSLWRMCQGQPIAVRIAVHQCAGEWIGVDGAAWYRDAAAREGDAATAALFDAVMRDELGHVRLGHRWLQRLCPDDADRAATRAAALGLRRAAGKSVDGSLAFPLDEALCRAGGLEDSDIAALAARYRRYGSRAEAAVRA